MTLIVLGTGLSSHDCLACPIADGSLVVGVGKERLTRTKRDSCSRRAHAYAAYHFSRFDHSVILLIDSMRNEDHSIAAFFEGEDSEYLKSSARPLVEGWEREPYASRFENGHAGEICNDGAIVGTLARPGVSLKRSPRIARDVTPPLTDGKNVAWFQGESEFRPQALGNCGIPGDPRREMMKDILNRQVKFPQSFRPFAPAVPAEHLRDHFDIDRESPSMPPVAEAPGQTA